MVSQDSILANPASEVPTPALSLRPREAAKALSVSERTLWAWTRAGDVPHFRLGGAILYPVEPLRRWLEGKVQAAKTPANPGKGEAGQQ